MPASRLRSVDLPDPDGPISPMKSPAGTVIVTPLSTGISSASRRYDFETSRSSMSAMSFLIPLLYRAGPTPAPDALATFPDARGAPPRSGTPARQNRLLGAPLASLALSAL